MTTVRGTRGTAMAEDAHPTLSRATPATAPQASAGRGRVLVAEDNTLLQVVTVTTLRILGYDAEVVPNGREAVEAVERGDYVAVLMDCQMPEMNGYQATAEIRRREADLGRIPIIALTASWMQDDREACLAAGMDDYLTKPAPKEEIGAALQRWVR